MEFGVFSGRQIVRMADSALLADIVLAMQDGIVSTSPGNLTSLYRSLDESFEQRSEYYFKITESFRFIADHFGELRNSFMMKPYALHSLVVSLIHARYGIDAMSRQIGVGAIDRFAVDPSAALQLILGMAQAHEGKDIEGPFARYVWGAISTTDRTPRRMARVCSILRALGLNVADGLDANLS